LRGTERSLRRRGSESLGFAAFVIVKKSSETYEAVFYDDRYELVE